MSALQEYAPDFYGAVKAHGRDYYRRGDVRIIAKRPRRCRPRSKGPASTRRSSAGTRTTGPKYSCTCPYYQDQGDPCKHAWATVLQANAEGVLPDPHHPGGSDEENAKKA